MLHHTRKSNLHRVGTFTLSLHLIKVVNLKIPMTVTAGLQQTVQTAGCVFGNEIFWWFWHYFSPLCDILSCAYRSTKFSLAFSFQVFFMPSNPTLVDLSANIFFEEQYQSQSQFPQFLPVLPLASQQ